jgi:hypothetical protein
MRRYVRYRTLLFMVLSPREIATLKGELEKLEKARRECTDSGIRKLIDAWIEEKKKLKSGNS